MPKQVSRLTFEMIMTDVINQDAIERIDAEFSKLFGGGMHVDSACLVNAERIDAPDHLLEDEDDESHDEDSGEAWERRRQERKFSPPPDPDGD